MKEFKNLGWKLSNEGIENLARVITVQKNNYRLSDGRMEYMAQVSGKFYHEVESSLDLPAVGDWVEVTKLTDEKKAIIHRVLPRSSQFIRNAAGYKTEAQIIAANIDTVFIVNSLNHDLNLRRLERYLIATYESGASPVIVLTKLDECEKAQADKIISTIEEIAIGVPIIAISNITGEGLPELMEYLPAGHTGALIGSSGVGKSTLINRLFNQEIQATNTIRVDDSKGRHTTTYRELFQLPNGSLLIDTPGMRELQLWDGEDLLDSTFHDVEQLMNQCRFNDCKHETEPGCAIKKAMELGELTEERYRSYVKLQRELAFEKRRQDQKARLQEKKHWKQISKGTKKKYY